MTSQITWLLRREHRHPWWWCRWSGGESLDLNFFRTAVQAFIRTIFSFLQKCCWRTTWTVYQSLFLIYQCRSIEVYVPPDLMQVAIIITHKKSITTLAWHHGYSELNTSGKNNVLHFWPVWLWRWLIFFVCFVSLTELRIGHRKIRYFKKKLFRARM